MKYLNSIGIGLALLAFTGIAAAQQPPQQPPQQSPQGGEYAPPQPSQQQQQRQVDVSDQQLEQFSSALDNVRTVQQEYGPAIQEAESTDEAQELRAEAQEEMRGAVEDTGLSISEYNVIAQQLQSNQDLLTRLQDIRTE